MGMSTDTLKDRTDSEVFEERPVALLFGDTSDENGPLPEDKAWRLYRLKPAKRVRTRKFRQAIEECGAKAGVVVDAIAKAIEQEAQANIPLDQLVHSVFSFLFKNIDELIDTIYLYSPELEADREWLEEHGTDEQFMRAFIEIVKFTFGPFGRVLGVDLDRAKDALEKLQVQPIQSTESTTDKPEHT